MASPSIVDVLATLPSGAPSAALRAEELSRYLKEHCDTDGEKERNKRHALRDELYRDGGNGVMSNVIDALFEDTDIRKKRKAFIPYAKFNNALKRMVNEMATTHSEPAKRLVSEGDDNYQKLLKAISIDEQMLQVSRLANLHRALLIGFRVRMKPDGTREPVLDIATPANVRAVLHPNDDSLVVGWMIRCNYRTARRSNGPKWTLWTDRESVQLRDDLTVIGDSWQSHDFGVIPWVPLTLGPQCPGFWPGSEGEDMVAGHIAIWVQNILLLKESKSATKQTVITGDGTSMMRGQGADSESPNELTDGQSVQTLDTSMDLSMFRDTADHVLQHLAQNYGMSPAIIGHEGAQSAEARELMRMPLKEIRRQQQTPMRRAEQQLARVMSAVCRVDLPDHNFSADDWRMEFAESETPLDPISEMTLFEMRRKAGVDNTVLFLQRRYPGITPEAALEMIAENVLVETERNRLMRPLMQISGSMGAQMPGAGQPSTDEDGNAPHDDKQPEQDAAPIANPSAR